MFPNDELTPYCPGERKALEAGDIPDEPESCVQCGEHLTSGDIDICGDCHDEFLTEVRWPDLG